EPDYSPIGDTLGRDLLLRNLGRRWHPVVLEHPVEPLPGLVGRWLPVVHPDDLPAEPAFGLRGMQLSSLQRLLNLVHLPRGEVRGKPEVLDHEVVWDA